MAGRIVAAVGSARASSASVTDGAALHELFKELAHEHPGLDAVVNVAGITRAESHSAQGTEEDWLALLTVHLGGYLNVLKAALPLMAAAGHGRIAGVNVRLGMASGRRRRVQLRQAGRGGPHLGSSVANSLLGATVTRCRRSPTPGWWLTHSGTGAALCRGRAGGRGRASLDSTRGPRTSAREAPTSSATISRWCSGQVLFAGGSEVGVVDRPRLLEACSVLRPAHSLDGVLQAAIPRAFVRAEAAQASDGGSNPPLRAYLRRAGTRPATREHRHRPRRVRSSATARLSPRPSRPLLEAHSIACHRVEVATDFDGAAAALHSVADQTAPIDAARGRPRSAPCPPHPGRWDGQHILADHQGIVQRLYADAAWTRAAADYSASTS